ncbi:phage tail tape measure protein [Enterococcus hirae]|uniref:phage tail tape measure protein n=1 Tax=Enterococcus hirae TaxID=1354 RepID=UPI003CE51994
MAKKKISGITIALDADTKGVTSGLKDIVNQSTNVSKELKDVERLLKLNPNNVELLSQKQELLSRQVELTTNKLEALKGAQADVERQFKSGEIGEEQYRKFKREIEATEGALNGFKGQLSSMRVEQEKLAQNTQRLSTFFEATGTDINDFSDVLGTRLTAAIKEGKANSSQLEDALNKIGRAALGQTADINKMKQALDSIDDGNSVQKVSSDLNSLKSDANKADDALDKIGDTLEEIDDKIDKGNLLDAGESLSEMSDKAKDMAGKTIEAFMEVEDAQKKLNASMGVAGTESAKKYEQALNDVFTSGLFDDMNEAADAVALVSKNLGDMSNQDLSQLVQDAKVLENTFGVDLKETIRGVAAMQQNYGITGKQALDMITVALQRNGSTWADEVGDNMAEYSQLWSQMGFSASETFQILENGTRNGAYNLDKVNDVVKEIGISLTDGRIEENIDSFSQKSKELFESYKSGGASQAEVIQSLLTDLGEMENKTEALSLASTVWSALGEDNSLKVLTSLMSVKGGYEDVQGAADKLNNDTTTTSQKMQGAWNDLKLALAPIGEELATALVPLLEGLTEILKMFQNLPGPVKTFIAAFLGISVILGIITGLVVAMEALAGIIGGSVVATLGIFAAVIAGIIVVIKNWGAITDWISDKWDKVSSWISGVWKQLSESASDIFGSIQDFFTNLWDDITKGVTDTWDNITQYFSNMWNDIVQGIQETWDEVVQYFTNIWDGITQSISNTWDGIVNYFSELWETIEENIHEVWQRIKDFFEPIIKGIFNIISVPLSLLQTVLEAVWLSIKAGITIAWEAISQFFSYIWGTIVQTMQFVWNGVVQYFSGVWNTISQKVQEIWQIITQFLSNTWQSISQTAQNIFIPIRDFFSNTWSQIKNRATELWNIIKEFLSTTWTKISTTASNIFTSVKDKLTSIWQGITSSISNVVSKMKDTVGSVFDKMRDKISSVVEKIKGIVQGLADKVNEVKESIKNFIRKIAEAIGNIKLPHFSLKTSSKKILGKDITYPSGIDVKWFADGGILTKPIIFGASGNKLLGGGEAGKEAVAPLDKLMAYIQKAVDVGLSKKQATDEIHLHLTAYGNLPKETLDQIAEYLMYKFVDLKNKNEFSG